MLAEPRIRLVTRWNDVTGATETVTQEHRPFYGADGEILHYEWHDLPRVDLREGKKRPKPEGAD